MNEVYDKQKFKKKNVKTKPIRGRIIIFIMVNATNDTNNGTQHQRHKIM